MHDVVVIGSGYGGAVMAARLSQHARVLLVERGRRWRSGEFPETFLGLAGAYLTPGNPLGLWQMRLGAGTGNALVSGYGGASLVNYGITVKPEAHVFEDWPLGASELDPYFDRARQVLGQSVNPVGDDLGDKQFLDMLVPGHRVDIENTIDWERCTQCGRCPPGCNQRAKRSLDRTYLEMAEANGVELALERQLTRLQPLDGGGWQLSLRRTGGIEVETVRAQEVVLAAGTFGTLDLLHEHRGVVPPTPRFGEGMTMNGDGLAFIYNTTHELSGYHGAPISTMARLPFVDPGGRTRTLTVMSGRIPKVFMHLSAVAMAAIGNVVPGSRRGPRDGWGARTGRRLRDLLGVRAGGALSQTYMYKLDAEDSSRGRATFDSAGRSAIDWPDYADDPIMRFAGEQLERWSDRVGGRMIRNLGSWPLMKSYGVHGLGGCRMGRSVEEGVVDADCRVYRPDGSVHPGLRIVDASVIPSSLGVPSSYTIAAIAERAAERMVAALARER